MDVICEYINLTQQLMPLYALLQRLSVKPGRSRKRERSRRREWTISVWPALWPNCLGRWHVGSFELFCYQTWQRKMRSMDPWVWVVSHLPLSTSSSVPSRGKSFSSQKIWAVTCCCQWSFALFLSYLQKVLEGLPLFYHLGWKGMPNY